MYLFQSIIVLLVLASNYVCVIDVCGGRKHASSALFFWRRKQMRGEHRRCLTPQKIRLLKCIYYYSS